MTGPMVDEQEFEINILLHNAVDTVNASGDLFDRVRVGAARRRKSHIAGGVLALAATMAIGVGSALALSKPGNISLLGSPHTASSRASNSATVSPGISSPVLTPGAGSGPLVCPAAVGTAPTRSGRPGTELTMVPGAPVEALVCTFSVTRSNSSAASDSTLSGQRTLTGSALQTVASALDKPVVVTAPCPFLLHYDEVFLQFRYAQGPNVAATFSTGCPNVYNGTLSGALIQTRTGTGYSVSLPPALTALLPN